MKEIFMSIANRRYRQSKYPFPCEHVDQRSMGTTTKRVPQFEVRLMSAVVFLPSLGDMEMLAA